MPKNDPRAVQTDRRPRVKILKDSVEIPGVISATVVSNGYYNADTFRASFALNAVTGDNPNTKPQFGVNWWGDGSKQQILLDIQISMDAGDTWKSLIIGQVDHMSIALEKGVCEVDGRDLTAYLIDNKTQHTYLNKTSSQVIELLAAKHGLKADVTSTSTLVGRYYSDDHDRMSMGDFSRTTTEWNLACSLAQHERFDVFVSGTTLHFHPQAAQDSDPYLVLWDTSGPIPWSNAMTIDVDRSMNLAKDIVVQVRSWHSKQSRSITKFAPSGSRIASVTSGKQQLYSFIYPNLTEAEAQDRANQIRADLTKHERLFSFTAPGDLIIQPRMMVKLDGTGSEWDQAYFVDSVSRTIGFDHGFAMSVKSKNHSAETRVLTT